MRSMRGDRSELRFLSLVVFAFYLFCSPCGIGRAQDEAEEDDGAMVPPVEDFSGLDVKELLRQISKGDPTQQMEAAYKLGKIRDNSVVQDLVALLRSESPMTRKSALFALGGIGDPRSIESIRLLLGDPVTLVSTAAQKAMERFGKAAEPSLRMALKDANPRAAWKAAMLLALLDNPAGTPNLFEAIEKGSPGEKLEGMKGLSLLGDMRAVPLLLDALISDEKDLAKKSDKPLREMIKKYPAAVDEIVKAMRTRTDSTLKVKVLQIISGHKNPAAMATCVGMTTDTNAAVRVAALAALGKDEARDSIPAIRKALDDPSPAVRRTAILVLGDLGDVAVVGDLTRILETETGDAARAAAVSLVKAGTNSIAPLMTVLRNGKGEARFLAARALGDLRAKQALEDILALARDKNPKARAAAAAALGSLGDPGGIELLVSALSDPEPAVVEAAVEGLSSAGEVSLPTLLAAYRQEKPGVTALICSDVMTGVGRSILPHVEKLAKSDDRKDRQLALLAAARIENDEGMHIVRQVLESDEFPALRATAASLLGTMQPDDSTPLVAALRDKAPEVSAAAATALAAMGDEKAATPIAELLAIDNAELRASAILALDTLRAAEAIPAILPFLEDSNAAVRAATARALGSLHETSAVPRLARLLDDPDENVREAAARALVGFEDPLASKALGTLAASTNPVLRQAAMDGLGRRTDSESLNRLLDVSRKDDHLLRDQALAAAAQILRRQYGKENDLTDRQLEDVASLLRSPDDSTRIKAHQFLGYAGAKAIPFVKKYTAETENKTVRMTAISTLGEIRRKEATPLLVSILEKDQDPAIQKVTLQALTLLRDPAALTPATLKLRSPVAAVRAHAAGALGRMGDARAVGALMKASNDPDPDVRKKAREGLLFLTGNKCPLLVAINPYPFVEPLILIVMLLCLIVPPLKKRLPSLDAASRKLAEKCTLGEKGQWWLAVFLGGVALALLTYSVYCQIVRPGLESFVSGFFPNLFLFTMKTFPFFVGGCLAAGLVMKYFSGRVQLPRSMTGAMVMGSLLPLCSCGVVPISRAMLAIKIPRRTVIAFLVVTPVLNPFVVVLSYGVIGFWYTFLRVAGTFAIAYLMGVLIEKFVSEESVDESSPVCRFCKSCASKDAPQSSLGLVNGLKLMGMLHRYIIIGILMGTLIAAYFPMTLVTKFLGSDFLGLVISVFIGVPIYLCTGEEVIFLKPLMDLGLPLGHAVAFTIAANGICISAIAVLVGVLGRKNTTAMIVLFFLLPFLLGYLINLFV